MPHDDVPCVAMVSPWGSGMPPGRPVSGAAFSTIVPTDIPLVAAPGENAFPLLSWQSPDGAPWLVNVKVNVLPRSDGALTSDRRNFVRIKYTCGGFFATADVDLINGSCVFPVPCDAFALDFIRGDFGGNTAFRVVASCSPGSASADCYAQRTVLAALPNNPATADIAIPAMARRVMLESSTTLSWVFTFLDATGTNLGGGRPSIVAGPLLHDIPVGASVVRIASTGAAANNPTAAVFHLTL